MACTHTSACYLGQRSLMSWEERFLLEPSHPPLFNEAPNPPSLPPLLHFLPFHRAQTSVIKANYVINATGVRTAVSPWPIVRDCGAGEGASSYPNNTCSPAAPYAVYREGIEPLVQRS